MKYYATKDILTDLLIKVLVKNMYQKLTKALGLKAFDQYQSKNIKVIIR